MKIPLPIKKYFQCFKFKIFFSSFGIEDCIPPGVIQASVVMYEPVYKHTWIEPGFSHTGSWSDRVQTRGHVISWQETEPTNLNRKISFGKKSNYFESLVFSLIQSNIAHSNYPQLLSIFKVAIFCLWVRYLIS